jgi:hypothetical protein
MKPWLHAEQSAKRFGGAAGDYIEIHDWFDQTKAHFPDMRHRAILHSSFGIYLCEQVFGTWISRESDGKVVQVRDIGEWHVIEDMGRIPTIQDYLSEMPMYDWLGGKPKKKIKMKLEDFVQEESPTQPSDFPQGYRVID